MNKYVPISVRVGENQGRRFHRAIRSHKGTVVRFTTSTTSHNNDILCLTHKQLSKVKKMPPGTAFQFKFSPAQMTANLQHRGGFLPLLLAALAPILGGVIGGVVEKSIAGSGIHDIIWRKNNRTMKLTSQGKGLFLSPYSAHIPKQRYGGSGLYLAPPPSSHRQRGYGLKKITKKHRLPTHHPLRKFPLTIFM